MNAVTTAIEIFDMKLNDFANDFIEHAETRVLLNLIGRPCDVKEIINRS